MRTPHGSRGKSAFLLGAIALLLLISAAPAQGFIYWANIGGTIGRANNDGSGANLNFIKGQHFPSGVLVRRRGGKIAVDGC